MSKKPIILLDVFSMLHRAYHALPPLSSPDGTPVGAVYGVITSVLKIVDEYSPYALVACTDVEGKTYRHDMFEEYKGTRAELQDDFVPQIQLCFDFFASFNVPVLGKEGYEADDVIGTLSSQYGSERNVLIITSDQDLLQLVHERVSVVLFSRGAQGVLYTEKGVFERFGFDPKTLIEYKGLRGDSSDNIPGVRGVGEVTAKKILDMYPTLEALYSALEKGEEVVSKRISSLLINEKDTAFLSRELATIQTNIAFDFSVSEWKPSYDTFFDFLRSLGMNKILDGVQRKMKKREDGEKNGVERLTVFGEDVDKKVLKETQVALWVLNSSHIDASLETIFSFTGIPSLPESYEYIINELKNQDLFDVYSTIEKPLISIIDTMQTRGVCVSENHLKTYNDDLLKQKEVLQNKMEKLAETSFNPASPLQVSQVLQDLGVVLKKKTATGSLTTNEGQLKDVEDQHPIISVLLEYRMIHKLQTGYTSALLKHYKKDGRIHTTFLQNGTTTGRMASRNPNLQNIPKHGEYAKKIRDTFVATSGFSLLSIDYSQAEIRIAALLSNDISFLEIVSGGNDIHTETAKRLFNKNDISKEERDRAKQINFGILYGMGPKALSQDMNISFSEARTMLAEYKQQFPMLQEYLERLKEQVGESGFVTTYFGRKRIFPKNAIYNMRVKAAVERAAINAPIQGTCADMIKLAMIKIDTYIQKHFSNDAFLLLQIHDELLFEVKKGKETHIAEVFQHIMENEVLPNDSVSFPTEASIGDFWGSLKRVE